MSTPEVKICKICNEEKELTEFYLKKNGKPRSCYCKICYCKVYKKKEGYNASYYILNKKSILENNKEWIERNKNSRNEYTKKYNQDNKENKVEYNKKYQKDNKDLLKEYSREYWKNLSVEKKEKMRNKTREKYNSNIEINREKKKLYIKRKMENDPFFKLKFNIRTLIRNSIKRGFTKKSKRTIEILGCSFEEFKIYLENKFDENMNWSNQGSYWQIDHIKPMSLATTEKEIYELNHYTNLQPLYWLDNIIKSDRY